MAKQDFAQLKTPRRGKKQAEGTGSVMSALGIVVIAAFCFTAGYWLASSKDQQSSPSSDNSELEKQLASREAENKLLQASNESLQAEVAQLKKKAEQGAHTKVGELSFYKDLPTQPVNPGPVPDKPVVKPVSAEIARPGAAIQPEAALTTTAPAQINASDNAYRVQLASFRNQSDAMRIQQQMQHAGFPALIKRVDLGEKGMWYRIYAGPYNSKAAAENARQQIASRIKLNGFLVRGR